MVSQKASIIRAVANRLLVKMSSTSKRGREVREEGAEAGLWLDQ